MLVEVSCVGLSGEGLFQAMGSACAKALRQEPSTERERHIGRCTKT